MSLPKERIHYLLDTYISKRASVTEKNELMEWILEAGEDSQLKRYVLEIWNDYKPAEDLSYVNWDEIYSRIVQPPVVSIKSNVRTMRLVRLAAAAVILFALGAGTYLYVIHRSQDPISNVQPKQNDIAPPSINKAILTLGDGTKIELDSTGNGTLAVQGSVQIIKKSTGEISYAGTSAEEVRYNTLSIPIGSKPMNLTLSDGSKVWINVGSSVTYPTAFTGSERKVKITGEAYFEVAHNSRMPFIVQHDNVTVNVIGTHFNVNTYNDEAAEIITLLEGSVRVNKHAVFELLKPGQQARINNGINSNIKVLNDVNMDEVVAWKNGKFMFDKNTDIGTIMHQISRWYNVTIVYQGEINQHFWGSISKDVNVSEVLKILEATGGVKFKVEGNKIMVMPAAT